MSGIYRDQFALAVDIDLVLAQPANCLLTREREPSLVSPEAAAASLRANRSPLR